MSKFLCLNYNLMVDFLLMSALDYTCAVLAAMTLFSGVNWVLYARKHYKGPRIDLAT
jgi:hypothetical protein